MSDKEDCPFTCCQCEIEFNIVWRNRGSYNAPIYCPFCGSETLDIEVLKERLGE